MKKMYRFVLLLLSLMLLFSLWPAAAAVPKKANYTLFVYMVGSDLESEGANATNDLLEMMKAKTSNAINLIIETGGTKKWHTPGISNQVNQRWRIANGKLTKLNVSMPRKNMGKPETLSNFLQWGIKTYPAKEYGVVFWDHGSGSVSGFGADEWFNHDMLTLPELRKAFEDTRKVSGVKFNWIGFDACLMATVETALTLSPYAGYLVASEELEPGHGWDYTPLVNALNAKPTIKGDELGRIIMNGFKAQAAREGTATEITLSVTDLSKVKLLVEKIQALFAKIQLQVKQPADYLKLAAARRATEGFGRGTNPEDNTDMADVGDWAKEVRALAPAESDQLTAALKQAVPAAMTSQIAPEATGLSMYFPYWNKPAFKKNLSVYRQIGFNKTYETFLNGFTGYLTGDTKAVVIPQIELKPNADDEIEIDIPADQLDQVAAVYSVLGKYLDKEETTTLILGTDSGVAYDDETGKLRAKFTGEWVTLNGAYVTMDINEEGDDYILYNIPAMVNGEDADIVVFYDFEDDSYTILGYWSGIESGGVVDRDITDFENGDEIVPLLEILDEESGESAYEDGEAVIWGDQVELERTELDAGAYSFGFVIEDFAQNLTYTDFYVYDVE